ATLISALRRIAHGLESRGVRASPVGHALVPEVQVRAERGRTSDNRGRDQRSQQHVLNEVLALIVPNQPETQRLHSHSFSGRRRSTADSAMALPTQSAT